MIGDKIYDLLPAEWPKVLGELPGTRDVVVGILEYDSDASTEYFGGQTASTIVGPIIKIVVRQRTYQQGQQWSDQVKSILHRYHDDQLLSVLMVGSPTYLGKSPKGLYEFQVTFRTQVEE